MADFTVVDPKGWEYDLHSVYSAYVGYFQTHNVPWWDRSWGFLFSSFEEFLTFSWPVIVVTDSWTGRAHIVTKLGSIGAFLKMIKTRFGETLPQAPNMLQVTPFETSARHLRHISDWQSYRKLHATLPAAVLSALRARVRAGEPKSIREIWDKRDKTFLALSFEWSERNEKSCLEFGYAAVRCGHLEAMNRWPPVPDNNYRKGHFVVSEYVDKVFNKLVPTFPWQYMFGDSQFVPKAKLPQVIQAVISSFATPDSETTPNTLVLVGHGLQTHLARLEDMKIKIPHNTLLLDLGIYERALHASAQRPGMIDPKTARPRVPGATILPLETILRTFSVYPIVVDPEERHRSSKRSLSSSNSGSSGSGAGVGGAGGQQPGLAPSSSAPLLRSSSTPSPPTSSPRQQQSYIKRGPVQLPPVVFHNSGNDAFVTLFALQMLLEPAGTQVFGVVKQVPVPAVGIGMGMPMGMPMGMGMGMPMGMPAMGMGMPMGVPMGMGMPMGLSPISPGFQVPLSPYPHSPLPPSPSHLQLSHSQSQGQGQGQGQIPANGNGSGNDLAGEFAMLSVGRTGSRGPAPGGANGNGTVSGRK